MRAKCGRAGNILITFDARMKPVAITHEGVRREFFQNEDSKVNDYSLLQAEKGAGGQDTLFHNDDGGRRIGKWKTARLLRVVQL